MTVRIATRRSALALAQSRRVAADLARVTGQPVELVEVTTRAANVEALKLCSA